MPSEALQRWLEYVGDPEDLLARLTAALIALDPDPSALSRAVIVSLVAAWETYVEELARESAGLRGDEGNLSAVEVGRVDKEAGDLNNPRVDDNHVNPLLGLALGCDPWHGVWARGLSHEELWEYINATVQLRHEMAHGQIRHQRSHGHLQELIAGFHELVGSLDDRARVALYDDIGRWPWTPVLAATGDGGNDC